jgi:hypothetical protein
VKEVNGPHSSLVQPHLWQPTVSMPVDDNARHNQSRAGVTRPETRPSEREKLLQAFLGGAPGRHRDTGSEGLVSRARGLSIKKLGTRACGLSATGVGG